MPRHIDLPATHLQYGLASSLSVLLLGAIVFGLSGCDQAPGPEDEGQPTLELVTSTSGDGTGESYNWTVGGESSTESGTLEVNDTTYVGGLEDGNHEVEISDIVTANCEVAEENPRTVTVTPGDTSSTTFEVACHQDERYTEYSGNGDDVVALEKPDDDMPALLSVEGNSEEHHFAITGYDEQGEETDLLVNTTEEYSGIVPVDLDRDTPTTELDIDANGSWTVEVYPMSSAPQVEIPGSYSGTGDNVLWLVGEPGIIEFQANSQERHFAVTAYDQHAGYLDLLVNTTDPYDGRTKISSDALFVRIDAVGEWSSSVE